MDMVGSAAREVEIFSVLRGSISESYSSDVVVMGVELRVVECISRQ